MRIACLALLLTACAATPEPDRRRPNVIVIMPDDQGYGDLSCHGNPVLKTPNLDALHARSVRLTDFHVDPTCSPTRAALMTGRYSSRTGVWHTIMGRSLMRGEEVTMAEVFAAAGYRTGIFGKWHLGDNYPCRVQDQGFQESVVLGGGGVGQTPDFWGNDYFDDTYWHNGKPEAYKGYCTDVFFREATRFIEASGDGPFFCYIPTNAAHGPFRAKPEDAKPYLDAGLPPARANFFGMIANIDENMGRLLAKLKELGIEKETIVVFLTDNGTAAGDFNAGMRGKKGSEYNGGHRVPCFVRWPGRWEGGRDVDPVTAHVDLLPTFIEACGLEAPKGVSFDGRSLVPLLDGKGGWPDRTLLVHSQRIEHPQKWRKSAVMTDRWHLVNGKELYDLDADPGQKKDVAAEHPETVEKLRKEYEKIWESMSTRFDETVDIVLGSEHEPVSRLTAHDWHDGRPPWNQSHIRSTKRTANGNWAVEIARAGTYEISLRRWPRGEDRPIPGAGARISLAGVEKTMPVPEGAAEVTFRVELPAGKTRLKTWFTGGKAGKDLGAYFAYVRRAD